MNTPFKAAVLLLVLLKTSCFASSTAEKRELERSLFFRDVYHEMSLSMSMEMGGSSKSSDSKSSKSGKKSKKSSSKSSKKGKKGKGGKKGKKPQMPEVPTPGLPHMPTSMPQPMPSMPMPSRPTPTSPPTPDQTPGPDDICVFLNPYDLLYSIDQSRIPNNQDYRGVASVTEEYLDEFFDGVLGLSDDIIYTGTMTEITDRGFALGQPVRVEYNTTIYFSPVSTLIPSDAELQALVSSAFRGSQNAKYVEVVQSLPRTNLFSTTSVVEFVPGSSSASGRNSGGDGTGDETEEATGEGTGAGGTGDSAGTGSRESTNTQRIGIASAAAAGAMVLLLTGVAIYRRRDEDEDPVGKFLDNDGHVTVAGDTYAGASSLDSQSGVHNISRPYEPTDWSEYQASEVGDDPLHRSDSPETTLEDIQENSFDESSESSERTGDSMDYEAY